MNAAMIDTPLPDKPTILSVGTTTIYVGSFLNDGRIRRREAERQTVNRLLRHAGLNPALLRHKEDGAPYIEGSDINISISHTDGLAAVAVDAGQAIGIDIQTSTERLQSVAGRFLTSDERQLYDSSIDTLLCAWTAKEAIFKLMGDDTLTISAINLPALSAEILLSYFQLPGAMICVAKRSAHN